MNAKKAAQVEITADSKGLDKGLNEGRKKVKTFGSDVAKIGGKIWGAGAGALSKLGTGFGIQAAAGISATVSGMRDFERNLVRLQIASGKSEPEMAKLRESILGISKATGVSNDDVLAGAQTYIDLTGDVAGAQNAMSAFARIAQASGSSVSDVATATAALKESMKLDPRDIETVFSGLIQQGKAGAVSLKDFAGELSRLAPQFARFGGSGVKGIADLGAALQITLKGFGSADQAAVGLQNMMTALSLNAGKFEAVGVKVFNKDPKTGAKTFRSFVDIVDAIGKSRLVKDPTALTKAFGSSEAERTFNILSKNRGELEQIYTAGLDAGAVQRDLNTYLTSSAGRLDVAMNNIKIAVVEAFTPERIKGFVEIVEKVSKAIGATIEGLEKLKGLITGDSDWEKNPFGDQGKSWRAPGMHEEDAMFVGAADWFLGGNSGATAADELVAQNNPLDSATRLPGPAGDIARSQAARQGAYNDAVTNIKGGTTREDRINRAVDAMYNGGGGNFAAGNATAASSYLRGKEGLNDAQIEEARYQRYGDIMAKRIADGLANVGLTVKMDSSAVAKSVDNAQSQGTPRR